MAETVAVFNFKGGAGKTQTVEEALYWLAMKGMRVIGLDADQQVEAARHPHQWRFHHSQ